MGIMNLSEIMDKSIDILRKHVKSIALFTVGYGIIAFLLILGLVIVSAIVLAIGSFIFSSARNIVGAVIIISIIAVLGASFMVSLYSGTIKIASQEYCGETVFAHDAIKISFKSIFKVFVIILSAAVMFIPAGGLIYLVGKKFFGSFDRAFLMMGALDGRIIFMVIYSIIFGLAVVFIVSAYAAWFSFALHALIVEKKGPFASIKRSFKLVRKDYWKVFGSSVLFNLVVYAIRASVESLIALIASGVYMLGKILNISQDYTTFLTSVYTYINWPLNLIFWMVVTPIAAIMLTMLYFNQRFKKEGFDLELRLKEIEKNDERKQLSETVEFNNSI
ncbi:hypothetical protein HMPREF1982_03089 [Clostridiales bacterium oral taxon 876 str. F0540]|nr:hypothetical protein HMPREF1982_03089 [Clostridiales bacterium oral taxon 876 str. F0540]